MEITIVGTGNMARGIGTRVVAGGHALTLHGREREHAETLARELGGDTKAGMVGDPVSGEILVLAVWYPVLAEVVSRYGAQLDGRIVVDISNPLDVESFEPILPEAGSAAQEIAASAPGARVVKAFNTTFATTLVEGGVAGEPLDVFIASDDEEAKRTVAQLVEDGGLRALDAGPLRRAHQLEAAQFVHMAVQQALDTGYQTALKVLAPT
jgi:8-hydroxy-5-deazaflavin:NADPH oxidoreductase